MIFPECQRCREELYIIFQREQRRDSLSRLSTGILLSSAFKKFGLTIWACGIPLLFLFFFWFVMDKTVLRNKRSEGGLKLKVGNLVGDLKSGEQTRLN